MVMEGFLPAKANASACLLVETLRGEATQYVPADKLPDINVESLAFTTVIDPANGKPGYEGVWRNALNERVGKLIINSDGSYFAEYDLCIVHPLRSRWFIEAVTAWGRDGTVKAEPRLLPMA
jgi:hypothetical protein